MTDRCGHVDTHTHTHRHPSLLSALDRLNTPCWRSNRGFNIGFDVFTILTVVGLLVHPQLRLRPVGP